MRTFSNPEVNHILSVSQLALVKAIAQPRYKQQVQNMLGFEGNQRSIDDIRNIVVEGTVLQGSRFKPDSFAFVLPADYLFHASSSAMIKKGKCVKKATTWIVQHDDRHEESSFDRSSFLWNEVNIRFFEKNRIRVFSDDFEVSDFILDYIRKPRKIFYTTEAYEDVDGEKISGSQDSELSESIHEDIVDFACFLTAEATQSSDYQTKLRALEIHGLT